MRAHNIIVAYVRCDLLQVVMSSQNIYVHMGYRAHSQSSTQHHLVPFLQLIFHSENGRFVFCGTFLCYISIRLMFLKNCQECTNKFRRLWAVYASNVSYIIRLLYRWALAYFCWHIFLHGIFVKFFVSVVFI